MPARPASARRRRPCPARARAARRGSRPAGPRRRATGQRAARSRSARVGTSSITSAGTDVPKASRTAAGWPPQGRVPSGTAVGANGFSGSSAPSPSGFGRYTASGVFSASVRHDRPDVRLDRGRRHGSAEGQLQEVEAVLVEDVRDLGHPCAARASTGTTGTRGRSTVTRDDLPVAAPEGSGACADDTFAPVARDRQRAGRRLRRRGLKDAGRRALVTSERAGVPVIRDADRADDVRLAAALAAGAGAVLLGPPASRAGRDGMPVRWPAPRRRGGRRRRAGLARRRPRRRPARRRRPVRGGRPTTPPPGRRPRLDHRPARRHARVRRARGRRHAPRRLRRARRAVAPRRRARRRRRRAARAATWC